MSDSNPPEAIEDKLKDIVLMSKYLRGRKPNPLRLKSFPNAIKELQAIITTETTNARIDELNELNTLSPLTKSRYLVKIVEDRLLELRGGGSE